jgi:hypothetical protein
LQDIPEFLALTLLVLHAQLTVTTLGAEFLADVLQRSRNAAAGDSQQQQQQQQQCERSPEEQYECLLSSECVAHFISAQDFLYVWTPVGATIDAQWARSPCWQQQSIPTDTRLVLLVLQQLLEAWVLRTASGALRVEEGKLSDSVLLLQLAMRGWQKHEAALCSAALRAAAAATRCLGVLPSNIRNTATVQVLLLQWLRFMQLALPESSSRTLPAAEEEPTSSTAAAAAAAAAGSDAVAVVAAGSQAELVALLLDVLTSVGGLDYNWCCHSNDWDVRTPMSTFWPGLAAQIAAALERIVRMQAPPPQPAAAATSAGSGEASSSAAAAAAVAPVATGSLNAGVIKALLRCLLCLCSNPETPSDWYTHKLRGITAVAQMDNEAVSLPAQQQLLGLLTSAVKLAAAVEHQEELAARLALQLSASHVLRVVQHTAHCISERFQEDPECAAAVQCVEPLAAPWLLLLAKVLRQRALWLHQSVSPISACDTEGGCTIGNVRYLLAPMLHLLPDLELAAAAAVARQLLERLDPSLQLVEHEGWIQVVRGATRRRPAPVSSSREEQRLAGVSAAVNTLQELVNSDCVAASRVAWAAWSAYYRLSNNMPADADCISISSSSGEQNDVAAALAALHTAGTTQQVQQVLATYEPLQQLPDRLLVVAEGLCAALPVPCCCNNPGCANLAGPSEQQLVAGKGCVCGRCRSAR